MGEKKSSERESKSLNIDKHGKAFQFIAGVLLCLDRIKRSLIIYKSLKMAVKFLRLTSFSTVKSYDYKVNKVGVIESM